MQEYVLLTGADKENLQPRSSKNSRHEALAEGRMFFWRQRFQILFLSPRSVMAFLNAEYVEYAIAFIPVRLAYSLCSYVATFTA